MLAFLWPRSLKGQVLLAIALALFLAQGVGALLIYRAQHERLEGALVHTAAFRLAVANRGGGDDELPPLSRNGTGGMRHDMGRGHDMRGDSPMRTGGRVERMAASPQRPNEPRETADELELTQILAEQGIPVAQAVILHRAVSDDPQALRRLTRRIERNPGRIPPERILIAAVRLQDSNEWLVARVFAPPAEKIILHTLFLQTLLIYAVLVGAMWLLLSRITRPLAALTTRLERFTDTRDPGDQLEPQGPEDVARLIAAHNAMEARIAALIHEKDVMLGAIGHDLKTPLAALRVRIESVENETERARMAATIEDITRSLDDILSLARVGRPSDPRERTELSALVAAVVEEYEDMGDPVELGETARIVLSLRATWIRRALRNLIGNALRYGETAHVSLAREGDAAVIRITDQGPGIPENQLDRMLEPFTRGEPSRNSGTGGAGLGLTLARAIADQHGGTLVLSNLRAPAGAVTGLEATIRLPIV